MGTLKESIITNGALDRVRDSVENSVVISNYEKDNNSVNNGLKNSTTDLVHLTECLEILKELIIESPIDPK